MPDEKNLVHNKRVAEMKLAWPRDAGPSSFANNVIGQADASGMVYLTFFQANPPILLGASGDDLKQSIEVTPVARVVLSKEDARNVAKIIQKVIGEDE